MMQLADTINRLSSRVAVLSGRVKEAADLSEVLRKGGMPQSPAGAFVLPLGLKPSRANASANAFTQEVADSVGVVMFLRTSGDMTGGKSIVKMEDLIEQVIAALCGWEPQDGFGAFELSRGSLLSAEAGLVTYQLDFSAWRQIRLVS